jgi:hypothetical protein
MSGFMFDVRCSRFRFTEVESRFERWPSRRGGGPQRTVADMSKSFPCYAGREAGLRIGGKDCWMDEA